MNNKFLHILISLSLTLAVTDYIWINLVANQDNLLEIEIEKEVEEEEKVRELEPQESKHKTYSVGNSNLGEFQQLALSSGYIKSGKAFSPSNSGEKTKKTILFHQIKIPS